MVARTTPASTSLDPTAPDLTTPDFLDRIVALRPALRRQAELLLRRRNHIASPDDLVQDVIVTALQSAHRYEDDNLWGWLLAILHGHVRNASRRAHARIMVPLSGPDDDAGVLELPIAATQEQPLHLDDVMTALRTLPAADQQIIWLARVDGLSQDAIAAQLDLPLGTVYSRLSRATARLRAACEAEPQSANARRPSYGRAA
jgi:RNA polymerase sigma-70 factor (ECF subfamily)